MTGHEAGDDMNRGRHPAGLTEQALSLWQIALGSSVRVREADGEEEYTIVSPGEVDATVGRISAESPVGKALMGRRPGECVQVQTPGGWRALTVVHVVTPDHRV